MQPEASIFDHPAVSGCCLFPQPREVDLPFMASEKGAELACYRRIIDPTHYTMVHFHGNGEAVADYVPWMADEFALLGLNSLFVEYRQYGNSTGKAQLAAMLGDGEAVIAAAGLAPEKVIALGRLIGSLYAIELVHRQPPVAGLILESGIADPSELILARTDLSATGISQQDAVAEVQRKFNHKQKLAGFRNPLLVLHAEHDRLINITHAKRNFEWAASSQKRLIRFPEGTHNSIMSTNQLEYFEALREFVRVVTRH